MDRNPYIEDNRDSSIITADYAKKTLVIPDGCKVLGVKGDHYGRRFECKLLNYPDSTVRFLGSNSVAYLQFENAEGQTGQVKLTISETTNKNTETSKEGEQAVMLSAPIPNSLTQEAGTARIQLCGSYQHENGTWIHWHLAPAEVEIADFFDNENIAKTDPKYNLVEQAHSEINKLNSQVKQLQTALNDSLGEIKTSLDELTGTEVEVGEAARAQITANKTAIAALQQKVNALESAGVDLDQLAETFATIDSVSSTYETKVDADITYLRKDDAGYTNLTGRVQNVENAQAAYSDTFLSKSEAEATYIARSDADAASFSEGVYRYGGQTVSPLFSSECLIYTAQSDVSAFTYRVSVEAGVWNAFNVSGGNGTLRITALKEADASTGAVSDRLLVEASGGEVKMLPGKVTDLSIELPERSNNYIFGR